MWLWISVAIIILAIILLWVLYEIIQFISLRRSYKKLQDKIVVITGASSGIGEALAHVFYKKGSHVVLCARRREELERVKNDLLKTSPNIQTYDPIIIPLDLSDITNLSNQVADILKNTGRIDILVNNAGVYQKGSILDTKHDVNMKIMLVNYFGTAELTKAVLPTMISQKSGHIVQVSSIVGLLAVPHIGGYCASKHALQGFSDSLRAEVAKHNIHVSVVSPGYVNTEISVKALTSDGNTYGRMEKAMEEGMDSYYVAEQIVKIVAQKKNEKIISPFLSKMAVFTRRFIPSVFFYITAKRAKEIS